MFFFGVNQKFVLYMLWVIFNLNYSVGSLLFFLSSSLGSAGHDVHVGTGAPDFVFTSEIQSSRLFLRKESLCLGRQRTFGINALSGEIPKELGLLTELQSLSFGTNNFSGPLPSELEDLTKLTQMWASDNAFTGRIPGFIGNNWSNITALRFEGNAFEGPIPASFSNLTSLTDLDLSFNNLTGRVPDVLFNLTLLTHLFLGDNKLTGTLSTLKRQSLQTISLPSGLDCLQRNFPCNRESHEMYMIKFFNRSLIRYIYKELNQLSDKLTDTIINLTAEHPMEIFLRSTSWPCLPNDIYREPLVHMMPSTPA
ncbi:hypothetical protein FXO37_26368 [Capsicum annuum]|nr:hypothetical protein FXO37_26368 [Capsicum annuum]